MIGIAKEAKHLQTNPFQCVVRTSSFNIYSWALLEITEYKPLVVLISGWKVQEILILLPQRLLLCTPLLLLSLAASHFEEGGTWPVVASSLLKAALQQQLTPNQALVQTSLVFTRMVN